MLADVWLCLAHSRYAWAFRALQTEKRYESQVARVSISFASVQNNLFLSVCLSVCGSNRCD